MVTLNCPEEVTLISITTGELAALQRMVEKMQLGILSLPVVTLMRALLSGVLALPANFIDMTATGGCSIVECARCKGGGGG